MKEDSHNVLNWKRVLFMIYQYKIIVHGEELESEECKSSLAKTCGLKYDIFGQSFNLIVIPYSLL